MMELDSAAGFDPVRAAEFFSALPHAPAVVRIEPRAEFANMRPYLIRTADLRRRMERLLGGRDPADLAAARRLDLRAYASGVRYRTAGSVFELAYVHWQQARSLDPAGYRERLHMRPPALLKLNTSNAYPRCYVTRHIRANDAGRPSAGFYFGPFPSRRAADAFASKFLDLFKIRRCQIKIRRNPAFPGCIYSEMKMCLAPCFAGCSAEEYAAEVARVEAFLVSGGNSLQMELESEREAASVGLDFERAAAVHRRFEKVAEVLKGAPELVRPIENLDAVIMQRAAQPEVVAVFIVRGGWIAEPFLLRFGQTAEPLSAEEVLRTRLGRSLENEPTAIAHAGEPLADHLALLARWFYSKPRTGEIFFREKDWPYRRLIRACARLLAAAG